MPFDAPDPIEQEVRGRPNAPTGMCPYCGDEVALSEGGGLTATHDWPKPTRQVCPGSGQNPRNAESDARPLWNGEPNRRFRG